MPLELYAANLPVGYTDEDIAALFSKIGPVQVGQRFEVHPMSGEEINNAVVLLDTQVHYDEICKNLKNVILDGKPFYITRNTPSKAPFKLKPHQLAVVNKIAQRLGETTKQPISQMRRLAFYVGTDFLEKLLEEALAIENAGGLMIRDGSRRRTLGGVFFWIARHRLSVPIQKAVFAMNQTKKRPAEKGDAKAQGKKAGGAKQQPQAKQAPSQKQKPIQPKPVEPVMLAPDNPVLQEAQNKLENLRIEYSQAQRNLEDLKSKPAEQRKSGLFSATREVVNLQKKITDLLKQYPQLDK